MTEKDNVRFKMVKRVETKDDGRFIIYYDFGKTESEQATAKDAALDADASKGPKE